MAAELQEVGGVSRAFSMVATSPEEAFVSASGETPSSIYFELAALVASRVDFAPSHADGISEFVGTGDTRKAIDEARATLAYRIGARAAFADFSEGNDTQLKKLMGYYVTGE